MNYKIKFRSTTMEGAYMKTKKANMRSCVTLLILGSIITAGFTFFQPDFDMSYVILGAMVAIIVLSGLFFRFGRKVEKHIDLILGVISFGLLVSQLFAVRASINDRFDDRVVHFGYILGILERLASPQLPRVELKALFLIGSLVARILVYPTMSNPTIFYQFAWWLLAAVIELLRERESRDLFKSFYDYREELIKFKNLMVSGLPINIMIVNKKLERKLFTNEYFQTTFQTHSHSSVSTGSIGSMHEWLARFIVEREGLNGSSRDALGEEGEVSMDEMIRILINKRLLDDTSHQFCFNVRIYEPNGMKKIYMVKIFSLPWGGEDAVAVILNDVTQQYQNLTLRVADSNKDKMIAMVSHELRTPLNGILGMIHIMEKQVTDSQVLTYLTVCKNSGKLLLNLVNSILDLGQIRNKKFQLKISKGSVNELLQEIFLLFEFQFKAKGLYLKMNVTADLPQSIVTDLNRLKQIIINLIGNALKFTFEGGVEIFVCLDPHREGYLQFRICDTGIGIKPEDQKKLFKMYGRLHQTDANLNSEGVGLGLTISDHLVRLLSEGEEDEGIRVESELEVGTNFYFSIKTNLNIPEAAAEYNVALSEGREHTQSMIDSHDHNTKVSHYVLETNSFYCLSPSPKARKMTTPLLKGLFNSRRVSETALMSPKTDFSRDQLPSLNTAHEETPLKPPKESKVLLVDDSPFNIMVAKHMLENLGYQVETALNGKIAVETVLAFAKTNIFFKIIFMDCQMPVMDGYEATKVLKGLMSKQEVKEAAIVALSANDSDEDKDKCREVGMCDHLSKPLNETRLKQVLDTYCRY